MNTTVEQIYQEANTLMEHASTPQQFEEAAEKFRQVIQYADAAEKLQFCEEHARMAYQAGVPGVPEKKSKKPVLIAAIAGGAVVLAGGIAVLANLVILPEMRYKDAMSLYEDGDYDEALDAFEAMGDYKDAPDMINACNYGKAMDLFDDEKYEKALKAFDKLGDYKDAKEQMKACSYEIALELLKDQEYEEAAEAFAALGDYDNAAKKAQECYYELGMNCYYYSDYEEAAAYFEKAGDSDDVIEMLNACNYEFAYDLYLDSAYEEAAAAFEALGDYSDAADMAKKCTYNIAYDLYWEDQYQEASLIFDSLGDYSDAADMADYCKYYYALELYDDGEYAAAKTIFDELGDFYYADYYSEYCQQQLDREQLEEAVTAQSGEAYLAIVDNEWWIQYWGDSSDMLAYEAGVAKINGNGSYTVSVTADTNGFRYDTTGDINEQYTPEGLSYLSVVIMDGEEYCPDAVITIDSITVDGTKIDMTAKNYTCVESDDVYSDIYNEWVSTPPDDARSEEGLLSELSDTSDYSSVNVDPDDFASWTTVEVTFTISGLDE